MRAGGKRAPLQLRRPESARSKSPETPVRERGEHRGAWWFRTPMKENGRLRGRLLFCVLVSDARLMRGLVGQ